ncbi:hypothetical protein BC828DRAFT_409574 [Blastocladiella britannica]|nr:hypothetical protein BC828DRAFT_409574 [Blastocladiella britannica]
MPILQWAVEKCTKLSGQKLVLMDRNLDCTLDLKDAAMNDTAEVLEWWHARGFPTTKRDWQQACIDAITYRQQFIDKCLSGPRKVSPFTLDFLATIVPVLDLDPSLQLPEGAYVCPTLAYLAAGHSLLLPAADDVDYHCQHDKFLRLWVHDVIITRKIAVFVQYWGDVMLYKPPLML